jgi:CheY-like chemotaxis protein
LATSSELISLLPYGRRYARALSGNQTDGDQLVARAIGSLDDAVPPALAIFEAITRLSDEAETDASMPPLARHLLLLTAVEELSIADAARVARLEPAEAARRLAAARAAVRSAIVTNVLIIEDESIIAMDLRMLMEDCGHTVIGVAGSEAEAIRLAATQDIGLILADINLGRGGNGIAAVRQILNITEVPVIFVTAYPEELLRAEGIEPAFVMRKPFDRFTLAVFTYQAITAGNVPLP